MIYPQKWEIKYQELRQADTLLTTLNKPLTFDRQTNSFQIPDSTPTPAFSSPLIRYSSVSSTSSDRILEKQSLPISQSPTASYTGLFDSEHQRQHKDCPAC